jgi:hypothetical protein
MSDVKPTKQQRNADDDLKMLRVIKKSPGIQYDRLFKKMAWVNEYGHEDSTRFSKTLMRLRNQGLLNAGHTVNSDGTRRLTDMRPVRGKENVETA